MSQMEHEIRRMIDAGMSKVAIGQQLGISRHAVRRIALKMGYERWKHRKTQRPEEIERKSRIRELAMSGLSLGEIGRKLGITRQCVHYHLRRTAMLNDWKAVRTRRRNGGKDVR